MVDNRSKTSRSYIMSRIKGKDTNPELLVRKLLFSLGYRYRLHVRYLPGKPDIVFPSKNKAIFVHGCFWHSHSCKRGNNKPASNTEYWSTKLLRNVERDKRNLKQLKQNGWKSLVIWECEIRDIDKLTKQMIRFLE